MGDMAETFKAMREARRQAREERLLQADKFRWCIQWEELTPWHWRYVIGGEKLNYWPSTNKVMWIDKVYFSMWPARVERMIEDLEQRYEEYLNNETTNFSPIHHSSTDTETERTES